MPASVTGLTMLMAAIAGAALIVAQAAPAGLLVSPTRPYMGNGNPAVRIQQSAYPRVATGTDDVSVRIDAPPQRIVSQSWATDDFLYAVVPPERVVGVSEAAYLERISNLTDIVQRHRPIVSNDIERVLRVHPDLVLTPAEARADIPGLLRQAGVPVYRNFTMFETLASIEAHLRLIGYLTGEDARADAAAQRFHDVIARAAGRRPAGARTPRVLGFNATYSYGAQTLFTDIMRVLGAENLAATHGFAGYDRLTDEHIVRWDPEWIVTGADAGAVEQTRARLLARPSIAATTAAKRGQILIYEYRIFLPLSPSVATFVDALSRALYEERPS